MTHEMSKMTKKKVLKRSYLYLYHLYKGNHDRNEQLIKISIIQI